MVHSVHTVRHLRDRFKCTCQNAIKRCRVLAYMKKQVTCLVRWNMYKLYLNGWKWINKEVLLAYGKLECGNLLVCLTYLHI